MEMFCLCVHQKHTRKQAFCIYVVLDVFLCCLFTFFALFCVNNCVLLFRFDALNVKLKINDERA